LIIWLKKQYFVLKVNKPYRWILGLSAAGAPTVSPIHSLIEIKLLAEIRLFAGNFAPRGWAFCDGQTLSIARNTALFSILMTRYGGDGTTNFQLPKLAPLKESDGGDTPIKYIVCLQGIYPSRP
jgi:microcystin-dependent protein